MSDNEVGVSIFCKEHMHSTPIETHRLLLSADHRITETGLLLTPFKHELLPDQIHPMWIELDRREQSMLDRLIKTVKGKERGDSYLSTPSQRDIYP